jgi:hypothetical protein
MNCITRPESIKGYEFTENAKPCPTRNANNVSRGGIYKTFNENAKGKKKDEFKPTILEANYGKNIVEKNDDDKCPVCSDYSVYTCYCVYNDKKCKEGHVWYIQRDGSIKVGNPH